MQVASTAPHQGDGVKPKLWGETRRLGRDVWLGWGVDGGAA